MPHQRTSEHDATPPPVAGAVASVGVWYFAAMLDIYSAYVALFLTVYLVATKDVDATFPQCDPEKFCGDVFAQSFALWTAYSLVILFSVEGEKEAVNDLLDLSARVTDGGVGPRESHHALRATVIDAVSDTARRVLTVCCVISTAPAESYELAWVCIALLLAASCGACCLLADAAMFWPSRSLGGVNAPALHAVYAGMSFAQKAAFLIGVRGMLVREDNIVVPGALGISHAPGVLWGVFALLACAVLALSLGEELIRGPGVAGVTVAASAGSAEANMTLRAVSVTCGAGGPPLLADPASEPAVGPVGGATGKLSGPSSPR